MLYSIENREDLENLNELISLQSQVKALRLQDNLGKQNFHEVGKKVFEPVTNSIKDVSEDVTRTITETSIEKDKELEKLNNKLLEIMNDGGILPSYPLSPLSKITNPVHTGQYKTVNDPSLNRIMIC